LLFLPEELSAGIPLDKRITLEPIQAKSRNRQGRAYFQTTIFPLIGLYSIFIKNQAREKLSGGNKKEAISLRVEEE
jgi:hypothetical protein